MSKYFLAVIRPILKETSPIECNGVRLAIGDRGICVEFQVDAAVHHPV